MENLRSSLISATRVPRSQVEGSTYLRLGPELKDAAQSKAAKERIPGGLSGAVKRLVEMWTSGEIEVSL